MRRIFILFALLFCVLMLFTLVKNKNKVYNIKMKIESDAFLNNAPIPAKYTCEGENVNPRIMISGVPADAKSLVLIMDDPDAPRGTFLHWILWDIPPEVNDISEASTPAGATVGENGAGNNSYIGPCPPNGTHRYYFRLFALNKMLELPRSTERTKIEEAMNGHIISEAKLMGTYIKKN